MSCSTPTEVELSELEKNNKMYLYNGKPYTGKAIKIVKEEVFDLGILESGKKEGLWRTYHGDGSELSQNYMDNKIQGVVIKLNKNKDTVNITNYLNDKKHGLYKSYRNSIYVEYLVLDEEGYYIDDKKEGVWKESRADKFRNKTIKLVDKELQKDIYIYPILWGFTTEIIKEQAEYLINISNSTLEQNDFQSFAPKAFGNIQGTFFNLFSIEQIVNPDLMKQ
jgi:hypothetical protein